MKKVTVWLLAVLFLLGLGGCGAESMNDIIAEKPSVTGYVEEVCDTSVLIGLKQQEGYQDGTLCWVSLDVQNPDSMTHFSVGDEVVVYFDGMIAESYPLQINTVYAITLRTPADRAANNKS